MSSFFDARRGAETSQFVIWPGLKPHRRYLLRHYPDILRIYLQPVFPYLCTGAFIRDGFLQAYGGGSASWHTTVPAQADVLEQHCSKHFGSSRCGLHRDQLLERYSVIHVVHSKVLIEAATTDE